MKNEYEEILYLADGSVRIPLKNILTEDHIVHPQMRVLKMENNHIDPVEIQDVWDDREYVYLLTKHLKTGRVSELMQILERDNQVFIWGIISLDYLHDWVTKRIMMRLIVGNTI